jgi:hypothetical protein
VNSAINLRVSYSNRPDPTFTDYLSSRATISFSRRIQLHECGYLQTTRPDLTTCNPMSLPRL